MPSHRNGSSAVPTLGNSAWGQRVTKRQPVVLVLRAPEGEPQEISVFWDDGYVKVHFLQVDGGEPVPPGIPLEHLLHRQHAKRSFYNRPVEQ